MMLKRMQRRFIIAVMASVTLVMILIIVGINMASILRMRNIQDEKLLGIYEYEQMASANEPLEKPPISDMPWAGGSDAEFTTRFFVVRCNIEGDLKVFGNEYISSIDEQTAERFTKDVLDKQKTKGRYGDYRYIIKENGDELVLVFLNVSDEMRYHRNLIMVSASVGLVALVLILILVVLLSRLAVRPYERNLQMQKQFITDAGHELKTPITSIATSADIAAMEYEGDEWIENIQQQAVRLAGLTNDLVLISRLDEEMPQLQKTEFSLSDAAHEVSDTFVSRAKAEDKEFARDIEDNIVMTGDADQIKRLLSVILDNAFKYSQPGGKVRVSLHKKEKTKYIEIRNTCIFDENLELDRIFDRFYRPDKSRSSKTGGSGLGLSIAKAIAEAHGGSISARYEGNDSIVFSIKL